MDTRSPGPATGELSGRVVDTAMRSAADSRGRLEVLTEREVLELVATSAIGRIAFVLDGWPIVLPVNFVLDGHDVVFRTDPGAKLDACSGGRVCFEADRADDLYQRGWSALGIGVADRVDDPCDIAHLEGLGLRPWAGGVKSHWVRVQVQQWSGRRLPRAWRYPMPTR